MDCRNRQTMTASPAKPEGLPLLLALYPSPALLAHLLRMLSRVDDYLIRAIAHGGEPLASNMSTFKDQLSKQQIWQVITYMRAGFPTIKERDQNDDQDQTMT